LSTPRDLLNAAKAEIREIDPNDVAARLDHFTLLDVREPEEYEQGAVPGAVHLPRGNLEFSVEGRLPDKNAPIAVYCAGGVRSAFATKTLQDLGYTDVVSIIGGFNKWKDEGLTWTTPRVLSADQRNRYQRHLLLPEVGEKGQMRLLDSKVLLLGAGGLGSPAALYLAAAVRDNVRAAGGDGVVIGTEYEPNKASAARAHFEQAGLGRFIDLREGDLRETLKQIEGPVDFMLVDIWIAMARPALELVTPYLKPGAIVVCDNTARYRNEYADYLAFLEESGFRTMTLPFDGGLEMSVRG